MSEPASALEYTWRECEREFEDAHTLWKDRTAREFEARFWQELETETESYLQAARALEEALDDIRRQMP